MKTADISNAYFQGEQLDWVLLLKPPSSGIPDEDYADVETLILARVPIYGTADVGRKSWKKFREVITWSKHRECKVARALYVIEENHQMKAMLMHT